MNKLGLEISNLKLNIENTTEVLQETALEKSNDYNPVDSELDPKDYFEEGYYQGQKDFLQMIIQETISKQLRIV